MNEHRSCRRRGSSGGCRELPGRWREAEASGGKRRDAEGSRLRPRFGAPRYREAPCAPGTDALPGEWLGSGCYCFIIIKSLFLLFYIYIFYALSDWCRSSLPADCGVGTRPSGEPGRCGENEGADKALGPPGERDSAGPITGPDTGRAAAATCIAGSFLKKVGTSAVPASRTQRWKGTGLLSVPRSLSLPPSIRWLLGVMCRSED